MRVCIESAWTPNLGMELPFLSSSQRESSTFLGRTKGFPCMDLAKQLFLPIWRTLLRPLKTKILHCTVSHLWARGSPWVGPHLWLYSSISWFWLALACFQGPLSSHNASLKWEVPPLSSWALPETAIWKAWVSHTVTKVMKVLSFILPVTQTLFLGLTPPPFSSCSLTLPVSSFSYHEFEISCYQFSGAEPKSGVHSFLASYSNIFKR